MSQETINGLLLKTQQQVKQIQILTKQLEASNEQKEELRQELILAIAEQESQKKSISNYKQEIANQEEMIRKLESQIEEEYQKNNVQIDQKQQKNKQIDQNGNDEEILGLQNIMSELKLQVSQLNHELCQQNIQIKSYEIEKQQYQQTISHYQSLLEKKNNLIKKLEQQFIESEAKHANKANESDEKIRNFNNILIQYSHTEDEESYKDKYDTLKMQYDQLIRKPQTSDKEILQTSMKLKNSEESKSNIMKTVQSYVSMLTPRNENENIKQNDYS